MDDNKTFDPKPTKYPYTDLTDKHYLKVKKKRDIVFDKDYPYVDETRKFRIKRFFTRVLLRCIVFPMARIKLGLKIVGKENLKRHKDELKRGVVSVCNHVHMWDYIAIMAAIKPVRPYVLAWSQNVTGESGGLVRLVGGVPIPDSGIEALRAFDSAIKKVVDGGGWIHVCAEGSMWEYYRPIRPFKKGFASIAVKSGKPVLPMAFSYRKPTWVRKKIFGQLARLTLNIGEPIYPDETLPTAKRITDLTVKAHSKVCGLAGFKEGENIYAPIYDCNSRRIDYY